MSSGNLRAALARDGIFNTRDLGGLHTVDGAIVRPGRLIRADSLHRLNQAKGAFKEAGIRRVIDLRDDAERERAGVLDLDGVEVIKHSILDPTFDWIDESDVLATDLLRVRYKEILGAFGDRLVEAVREIADVVADGSGNSAGVAFHCALGKDRTGLLSAMLLSILGVDDEQIVADYVRSSNATAVQVQWLWSFGYVDAEALNMDLTKGLWSAVPETITETMAWVSEQHGGFAQYGLDSGLEQDVIDSLRHELLIHG